MTAPPTSTDGVHREPCGCQFDDLTGLPVERCGVHEPKPMAPSDRLLSAALSVADYMPSIHGEKHKGDFKTCRALMCIESRELVAAIRACLPGPDEERITEEVEKYPLSRGD